MLRRRPEAIVVTGGKHTARGRKLLENSGIPVVETWDLPTKPVRHVVGFSNAEAAEALVRYLHAKGYRRIAFIGGTTNRDTRGADRRPAMRGPWRTRPEGNARHLLRHAAHLDEAGRRSAGAADGAVAGCRGGDLRVRSFGLRRRDGMPAPQMEGAEAHRHCGLRRLRDFQLLLSGHHDGGRSLL